MGDRNIKGGSTLKGGKMENSLVNLLEIVNQHSLKQLRRYLQENPEEYNEEKHGEFFSDEEKLNLSQRLRGQHEF